MGVRFNKSIKLGNFLRLNFSKSGITASVGKKGASINIGKKGTFLNLSPAAVGVNGTGVSYRTRIAGGKKKSSSSTKKSAKTIKEKKLIPASEVKKPVKDHAETEYTDVPIQETALAETIQQPDIVEEYLENLEAETNLHKYTDNVLSKAEYDAKIEQMDSEAAKEIYQLSIDGDEDTIENLISTFMSNLELAYDARVSYELEDHVLYVDLDLPEIEDLSREYPYRNSDGRIGYKRKTTAALKEEYARLVMSIGVFLSANFFNISSYIEQIVMSAFTTVRDKKGDLVDQYLYSVRYERQTFENTDLAKVDDLYGFMLEFENRINMSSAYGFKPIQPYEMDSAVAGASLIEDALLGLKELGYKAADIAKIKPELAKREFGSSSEYLKEGLRLIQEMK